MDDTRPVAPDAAARFPTRKVLLQQRLQKGKERLDSELEHIHYFCGNMEIPADLQEREPQRVALYKATAALVRAHANISDEFEGAGYSAADVRWIKQQLNHYLNLREIIRKASRESLDLKAYEADMRHLIDTYIETARKISPFDNVSLLELIVKSGIADAITSRLGRVKYNEIVVAETIENNVHGAIAWGEQIELCPDAVYMRLTGKTPEDVFRSLNSAGVNA